MASSGLTMPTATIPGPMKHRLAARFRGRSSRKLAHKLAGRSKAFRADQRGVAAIEFGVFAIFLSLTLANVADVSIYIFQRMQAENATQVAAQAAWKACDLSQLPAITNCPGLATAIQNEFRVLRLVRASHWYPARHQRDITASIRQTRCNTSVTSLPSLPIAPPQACQACNQVIIFRCKRHFPTRHYSPVSVSRARFQHQSTEPQ